MLRLDINDLNTWTREMDEQITAGAGFIQYAFSEYSARARDGVPSAERPKIFVHG